MQAHELVRATVAKAEKEKADSVNQEPQGVENEILERGDSLSSNFSDKRGDEVAKGCRNKKKIGNLPFKWNWIPAVGHSGGILMGGKEDMVELEAGDSGSYFVSMVIRDRRTNFRWEMMTVYGPANHDFSSIFLEELDRKCNSTVLPVVIGGDFNLIREMGDKNSSNYNWKLIDMFNEFIYENDLIEIKKGGGKYTWTNKQKCPILVNLDRVFVSLDWEAKFPLCHVQCLLRVGSDHCPILLTSGETDKVKTGRFFYEQKWMCQDNFRNVIQNKWTEFKNRSSGDFYSLDTWNGIIAALRCFLRGWGANLNGAYRKSKDRILNQLKVLDSLVDDNDSNSEIWSQRFALEIELEKVYDLEEKHWQQRGKSEWLTKGDANTGYFHTCANGRRRKNFIFSLEYEGITIRDNDELRKHIYDFYKDLFGAERNHNVGLTSEFWKNNLRVSDEDNILLLQDFTEMEVEKIIKELKVNSAPGPDGFPNSFYKDF
uniref:Putative retrotransposon protein n=1 Tax=Phyllostachys edulis TaxID=38705 RepID=D3IVK1_PHYED|nr:putative retrotransposon protein [Phyllostachys edulis]